MSDAARLAGACLIDTLEVAFQVPAASVFLGYAADPGWEGAGAFLAEVKSRYPLLTLLDQGGGSLGDRMALLARAAYAAGARKLLLMGGDTPHLRAARLEEALAALQTEETVVLGPSHDGGYYLLGMREPRVELLHEVAWSTSSVLSETLIRAEGLGLKVTLLPTERDLDTIDDLRWLVESRQAVSCPNTRDVIAILGLQGVLAGEQAVEFCEAARAHDTAPVQVDPEPAAQA
jgi:rSAM/selenodomain-associated transferase 1